MLTDKEVEHIANLARIKLADKEKEKFKKELSSILDYIKKLNELDTDGIQPLYQTTGIINALRPDEHRKDFEMDDPVRGPTRPKGVVGRRPFFEGRLTSNGMNEKLIGQAPSRQDRFIKVRSVLKK